MRENGSSTPSMCARLCAMLLPVLVLTSMSAPTQAHPPLFRGIDLDTVLTTRDRARALPVDAPSAIPPRRFKQLRTIVIDPGHGGENQGALGVADVHEKFLTMNLAYQLRDRLQLEYPDARVVLTRYWDQELQLSERIHMANRIKADLFISLHYNAAPHDRAAGVETYFLSTEMAIPTGEEVKAVKVASRVAVIPESEDDSAKQDKAGVNNEAMMVLQRDLARARQHRNSGKLAEIIQDELVDHTGSPDRGVKQANFGVLRGALMPAVVVEAGFVTHPYEGRKIMRQKYQDRVVQALMDSLVSFDDALEMQVAQ